MKINNEDKTEWARTRNLLEEVCESGEPQSEIRIVGLEGKAETLPECLIPVIVAALREIRFGHTPTVTDGDLPVDLMQASILTGCGPEALNAAVELDRIPSHRMPDGRHMVRIADVVDFLEMIIPDGEIAQNRHLLYRIEAGAWETVEFPGACNGGIDLSKLRSR